MIPSFDILISEEDFNLLQESGKICKPAEDRTGLNTNANFARALSWITNNECAMITAWRQKDSDDVKVARKVNEENNRQLVNSLREYGYGVIKSLGWYQEEGNLLAREYSYLVFNHKNDGSEFFERMKSLAETFSQDSFLYKRPGAREQAYLYFISKNEHEAIGFINFESVDQSEDHSMIGHHPFVFRAAED